MALCVSTNANKDHGEIENHSSKLLQVRACFLIFSFHQGRELGWPTGKGEEQCCVSFYKHTSWKQSPIALENAWETEYCMFKQPSDLEGDGLVPGEMSHCHKRFYWKERGGG